MDKPTTKTLHLPCALTEQRREDLQAELVECTNRYEATDEMKKRMNTEHTAVLKTNRAKMALSAKTLEQGYEIRPIECEQSIRDGKVVTMRLDTKATIDERDFSAKDFE